MERSTWLSAGKLSVGRKKLAATTLHDTTVLFGGGFKSGVEPAGYRAEVDMVTIGVDGTHHLISRMPTGQLLGLTYAVDLYWTGSTWIHQVG